MNRANLGLPWLLALAALVASCMFYKTEVGVVDPSQQQETKNFIVKSAAKLHLKGGDVVLYEAGFEARDGQILGQGERYDFTRSKRNTVSVIAAADVEFVEFYDRKNQRTVSTLTSVAAVSGGIAGTVLLYKAIFGSCPTVYSASGDGRRLEAELFSHSISAGFEMDDLDRLDAVPADGAVSIDVANEALETHYVNRINLLAVDHPAGYTAFPGVAGNVVMVGRPVALSGATSRAGEDVSERLASRDGLFYQSGDAALKAFVEQPRPDWIDLAVDVPADTSEVLLTVRMRNTLLATVFLYDIAMASQGLYAIDWMSTDSVEPQYAARFARWFNDSFGIDIRVLQDGEYRRVEQIPPTGPIAWKQVAAVVPVKPGTRTELRLQFTPDNWAIDWVGVSFATGEPVALHTITPDRLEVLNGNRASRDVPSLADADARYAVSYPGDLYRLSFRDPPRSAGLERSYLLASRGYYVEWLRMDWVEENGSYAPTAKLEFNDALLQRTARVFLGKKTEMESRFYATRLPLDR